MLPSALMQTKDCRLSSWERMTSRKLISQSRARSVAAAIAPWGMLSDVTAARTSVYLHSSLVRRFGC